MLESWGPMPGVKSTHSEKLLAALMRGEIESITPKIGSHISYPQVEALLKVNTEKAIQILEELWEEGYLHKTFHSTVYSCPICGTSSIRPKVVCPKCRSEDIERVELVEHLGQGHIDIEERFLKDGEYVCPVCNKPLKLIGVDYRKPGHAYLCANCKAISPEPLTLWTCNPSGHVFSLEEARSTKVYSYSLNHDRIEELSKNGEVFFPGDVYQKIEQYLSVESSTPIEYIQEVSEVFQKRGYKVENHKTIEDPAGGKGVVAVYAKKPPDSVTVVNFLTGTEDPTGVIDRFANLRRSIRATRGILIVPHQLDQELIDYAKRKRITVIDGVDIYDAIEKLELLLDINEFLVEESPIS